MLQLQGILGCKIFDDISGYYLGDHVSPLKLKNIFKEYLVPPRSLSESNPIRILT